MADLKELVAVYYDNKQNYDYYKKQCDAENAKIKELMVEQKLSEVEADGIVAKYVVQHKESFDEEKLLQVLKDRGCTDVIKTREYVDMDSLEDALYHDAYDKDTIVALDTCRVTKEVVQLRLSKKKEKHNEGK